MSQNKDYVLITPVKNEQDYISLTIESVLNQTVHPVQWVIVSDGSTDRTNEIIQAASKINSWIRLLALPPREKRNFASVVHATEAGIRSLTVNDYQFIGLLDSDLRFQSNYFEQVIGRFDLCPKLGMAGGVVIDVGMPKCNIPRNKQDVPGAVQFFRKSCFESLGGLIAVPEGGWDALTCVKVRMLGFDTRLLTDLIVDHLKPRNVFEGGVIRRNWQMGVRDYALGFHPVFEVVKCLSRLSDTPFVVGAISWWLGYFISSLSKRHNIPDRELYAYLRKEQIQRILKSMRHPVIPTF